MLTIPIEHQYPAWYAARESPFDTLGRRTMIADHEYYAAPLQKDLGQDESASFHYINAPVKITPPPGMKLLRFLVSRTKLTKIQDSRSTLVSALTIAGQTMAVLPKIL
jgi:hypothetical protein